MDEAGQAMLGLIGEPCKRYLTRRVKGDRFRLYCDRPQGHAGRHRLANGTEWTHEGQNG
ncbi:hypothetical protein SEA_SCHMIDT_52 [Gordonia phage Schmidt]|uniref:Uncharacterized protein n=1 Tax=Gordonia phage Schmidt TaxID=2301697 RepID=A0A385E2U7_9CAUD|nr:hypothetical protein KDJ59_gp52 [Gordonia phage Schmidt]AXQ65172.1 hypothetical protein SEA_SCHMIDT_52 [Gordonia phage Schmidt]